MHSKLTEHGRCCAKQPTHVKLDDKSVRLKFINIGFKRGCWKLHSSGILKVVIDGVLHWIWYWWRLLPLNPTFLGDFLIWYCWEVTLYKVDVLLWLLILIAHLYLSGRWLDVAPRVDSKKMSLEEIRACNNKFSRLNRQHNWGGNLYDHLWSFHYCHLHHWHSIVMLQAVDGLYCVGDSCFPGQGVIAVAFSGTMCAHRVAADLGKWLNSNFVKHLEVILILLIRKCHNNFNLLMYMQGLRKNHQFWIKDWANFWPGSGH